MTSALAVQDISVAFGGNVALDKVSLSVRAGEILGLVGPNGAGKTTLLNAISKVVKLRAGRVFLGGRDVTDLPFRDRCRAGLSRTFQIPRLSDRLTVSEQLAVHISQFHGAWPWSSRQMAEDTLRQLLDRWDLWAKQQAFSSALTLGQLRRFELARALAADPKVLLVDEPASGMSGVEVELLARQLRSIAASGVAIILVEHDIPFVRSLADRLTVMNSGTLLAEGDVSTVLDLPEVKEAYLGRA